MSDQQRRRERGRREAARVARPSAARKAGDSAARLKAEIARRGRDLGASLIGFAPVPRWGEANEVPAPYRPDAIWPQARTVVTFGVPMLLPIIDSTPSINYQEMYNTANRLLDDVGYRLAVWLSDRGHASIFLPRDGYGSLEVLLANPFASFSHVMSAKYAGLGTLGLHHSLITREYGPRLRLASIFTSAELPGDPLRVEDHCTACRVCERLCPVNALRSVEGELVGHLDKEACTRHHIKLREEEHWPCGICVKVCPVGEDRTVFESFSTKQYREERPALEKDLSDPRWGGLVHLRKHGSAKTRIA
ncbi:MAG TPA: 4Fe-4S binding protein [Anaeromyxobacter sp.]